MNRRAAVAALLSFLLSATARAENWPQWRGPHNDGISGEKSRATEWDADKNIAWKLPLPGKGGSTPVVWGDRLFLTCGQGKDIVLLCVSTGGKELWKQAFSTGDKNWMRDEANNASPSPCTDGKHVWVLSGTGDLACFDFEGKEVWRGNLQERYGQFRQNWGGIHASPLLDGDRLYLALLHANGAWVIALDKATGKEVWKVERQTDATGESKESYASPVLGHDGKEAYLITHGGDYAVGHRLKDGSEIFRVGDLNPKEPRYRRDYRFVASPAVSKDLIVVPSAKRGAVVGVKPDAHGLVRAGSPFELWRKPSGTPDVSSPLIHDGLVYLSGESGTVTCLEAKTGKEVYSERIHGARYRGSPVYANGKVYFTARDGVITVVKAGPTFQRLAENHLPDQISASPAISGGKIFLHGFEALYAIGR